MTGNVTTVMATDLIELVLAVNVATRTPYHRKSHRKSDYNKTTPMRTICKPTTI